MDSLTTQDWYQALVDDCKSIITEAVFTSRWALVEGYWNLGKRLREDTNFDTKGAKPRRIYPLSNFIKGDQSGKSITP